MRTKLTCQCKLTLETECKAYLLVTFIQRFVTKSKLSLVFTETLLFPHKTTYFLNDRHGSYKNADGNSKSYRTKLIPFSQFTFWKQPLIAENEVKVIVILINKHKVKAKNFIIPIFSFAVLFVRLPACYNTSTFSFFNFVSFFFEDS